MSYPKTEATDYGPAQECDYGVEFVRIDGLRKSGYPKLRIGVGFQSCAGDYPGVLKTINKTIPRAKVISEFTAQENRPQRSSLQLVSVSQVQWLMSLKDASTMTAMS